MKRSIKVYLGERSLLVGTLFYSADGNRETSGFAYDDTWLERSDRFQIDSNLPLVDGPQFHRKGRQDGASVFHGCFADSEPDGWGVRVIRRDYAKQRRELGTKNADPLNSLDILLYVDDFCRIGALRFMDETGEFVRPPPNNGRSAPPLIELATLLNASRAVENGTETAADLRYLLGKGTSLGGMRPKCTVVDDDGTLSIGKFPSETDSRPVTKGEVLALRIAAAANTSVATARIVYADGTPVTLVRRFDRQPDRRIMYASARSMLSIDDDAEHSYTEMADTLRRWGAEPDRDCEEIWRRLLINIMITNVDDHLNNHGFLHMGRDQWRLAPAFDINPFPDKARTLKTWISEEAGPEASIELAMTAAPHFGVDTKRAKEILGEVADAVSQWRQIAASPDVDMAKQEIEQFEAAFEHPERSVADDVLRTAVTVSKSNPTP